MNPVAVPVSLEFQSRKHDAQLYMNISFLLKTQLYFEESTVAAMVFIFLFPVLLLAPSADSGKSAPQPPCQPAVLLSYL